MDTTTTETVTYSDEDRERLGRWADNFDHWDDLRKQAQRREMRAETAARLCVKSTLSGDGGAIGWALTYQHLEDLATELRQQMRDLRR